MLRLSFRTFLLGGAAIGGVFGVLLLTRLGTELPAPPPPSLEVTGPAALVAEASAGAEAVWKISAPVGAQGIRVIPEEPLRVARGCDAPLPPGGTCDVVLRLPSGALGEGKARVVVIDAEGRRADAEVAWRRIPDPFSLAWEALAPARPDSPGAGRLWIQNRSQDERALPAVALPETLTRTKSDAADCPAILPPQGRCALTLRWTGGENGAPRLRIQVPGAAPIEVALPAEGFDPLPRWSPLAPFVADPSLGAGRQTLEITNAGKGPLSLSPVRIEGMGFAVDSSTCPERLPAGLSCAMSISFQSDTDELEVGRLRIGDAIDLPLHGKAEGNAPRLAFEGETTAVAVAGADAPTLRIAVRLRNLGSRPSAPLEVRHVGDPLPGGAWAWETRTCPALAPGEACEIVQEGTAAEDGTAETVLVAPGAMPHPLRWAVSNLSSSLSVDPPGVLVLGPGEASVVREVRLRNTGNAPARLTLVVEGTGYVLELGDCGPHLAPGASCALRVRWTPPEGMAWAMGRLEIAPGTEIDLMGVRP